LIDVWFLIDEVSITHIATHHSQQDSSGRVISSSQRPLPDNTQHSQQIDIHAPGESVHICSWKADSFSDRQITLLLRSPKIRYPPSTIFPLDPVPESAATNPQPTLLFY